MKGIRYREVYPGIFQITRKASRGNVRPQVNLYLIAGEEGLIFDAGHGDRKSVELVSKTIREICRKREESHGTCSVKRLMVSHAHGDHFSGAMGLSRKLGLEIILTEPIAAIVKDKKTFNQFFKGHRSEKDYTTTSRINKLYNLVTFKLWRFIFTRFFRFVFIPRPHRVISPVSKISINGEEWEIFPSPGHCPAHISLYNKTLGIIFTGDNILRSIAPWLGPPRSCLSRYMESLEAMLHLPNLKVILPGHGSPIENPRKRVEELIQWRTIRTSQVKEAVCSAGESGMMFKDILLSLYPGSSRRKRYIAKGWVQLTLDFLESRGVVERVHRGSRILFRSTAEDICREGREPQFFPTSL
jgi:glyoxylase-like metal-dependent hydrolase (beta-lactamase superfamily II)